MQKRILNSAIKITTLDKDGNSESTNIPVPNETDLFKPFPIDDPFNIRQAVVPVFANTNLSVNGVGTAFNIDCMGTFVTAEHVVEIQRQIKARSLSLLLGYGIVFGTVQLPKEALAVVNGCECAVFEKEDPLRVVSGAGNTKIPIDLARVDTTVETGSPPQKRLLVDNGTWKPHEGEIVFAMGFPTLDCSPLDTTEQVSLITESLVGAFGRVRAVHLAGTNSSAPTPVFEVEGNWMSGMSGGPVLNLEGKVVGVVSRSIYGDCDQVGIAYATYFSCVPHLNTLLPSIDFDDPERRVGWGVFNKEEYILVDFYIKKSQADSMASNFGEGYKSKRVSLKSLNNFIFLDDY
jgi:serine protease Do